MAITAILETKQEDNEVQKVISPLLVSFMKLIEDFVKNDFFKLFFNSIYNDSNPDVNNKIFDKLSSKIANLKEKIYGNVEANALEINDAKNELEKLVNLLKSVNSAGVYNVTILFGVIFYTFFGASLLFLLEFLRSVLKSVEPGYSKGQNSFKYRFLEAHLDNYWNIAAEVARLVTAYIYDSFYKMLKEKENSGEQLNFNETQTPGEQINFNDYILTLIYSLLVSFANYTKKVYDGSIEKLDKEMLISIWKRFIDSILLEGTFEKISKKEISSSDTFPFLDYNVTQRLNVTKPGKVRPELDERYRTLFYMADEYSDRGVFLGLYENDVLYNYVVVVPNDVLEGLNVYTLSTRKALRLKSKGVESLYYDYEQEDEQKYFADIEFNENLRSNANISSNFIDMVNTYGEADNSRPTKAISLQDIYYSLSSIFSGVSAQGVSSDVILTLGFEEDLAVASIIRVKVSVKSLVDLTSRVFNNYVRSVFKDFLDFLRSSYNVQGESKIEVRQEIESYFKLLYFRDFQNMRKGYDVSQAIEQHLLNIVSYATDVDIQSLVASAKGPHVLFDIYTELFIKKARMAFDVYKENPVGKNPPIYVLFIDEFFTQLNPKNMSVVLKLWDGLMNRSEKFPPNFQIILAGNAPGGGFIEFLDPDSKSSTQNSPTVSRDTLDAFLNRVSFYILLPHFDYVTSSFTKEALGIYYLNQMRAISKNPVVDLTYEQIVRERGSKYVDDYIERKFKDDANLLELIRNVLDGKEDDVVKLKNWAENRYLVKDAYIEILSSLAELRENVTILAYYKVWTLMIPIFLHSAFAAVFDVLYRVIKIIYKEYYDQI
ncbi:hypothetical protein D6810_00750, partial [Candidatus Dojkabacteria bacterium]